jgi:sugar lactone lactonase YvrE
MGRFPDRRLKLAAVLGALATAGAGSLGAQIPAPLNDLPNPYRSVDGWAKLPDGRTWGSTAGVDIDPDGVHLWALDRCGGNSCAGSNLDPVLKFDPNGNVVASFGGGMMLFPHGIHVDRDGNVWIADGQGSKDGTKGHQVIKFDPDGKVLMRLGTAGKAGSEPGLLNQPNDVITTPNGDIFVADGHSGQNDNPPPGSTGRIIKYTKDGKYVKEWGKIGRGPGEFRTPHSLAFDSRGRLFVADRGNHRIQIFDQEGKLLDTWYQFSRISGLFIDRSDNLYAIDSETSAERHPNWTTGIRIGTTREDKVVAFIPPHKTNNAWGAMGEGVAVDGDGNVYAAEGPISRPAAGGGLTKFSKK